VAAGRGGDSAAWPARAGGGAGVDRLAIRLQGVRRLPAEFIGATEFEPDSARRIAGARRRLAGFERGRDLRAGNLVVARNAYRLVGVVRVSRQPVPGCDVGRLGLRPPGA